MPAKADADELPALRAEVTALRQELAAVRSQHRLECGSSSSSCGSTAPEPPAIPVLGVASIFHAGYLMRCIRSVDFAVRVLVVVHNGRDPGVAAAVATLKKERPQMRVVHEPENTGCAGGWNRILAADPAAPWWLVVNDDIAFPPGALRNIASRVWAREQTELDAGHYKFWYQHGASGWSCFALMARAVRTVGTFDENIFPVYFEDEDYELRLRRGGLRSVHLRDVLVVHGSEEALEYESGSMTALSNGTGEEELRGAFTSQLLRSGNREYLLAKWGAPKPKPDAPDLRWRTPFNRQLPLAWWRIDAARRACIVGSEPVRSGELTPEEVRRQRAACPFDEALAAAEERRLAAGGARDEL